MYKGRRSTWGTDYSEYMIHLGGASGTGYYDETNSACGKASFAVAQTLEPLKLLRLGFSLCLTCETIAKLNGIPVPHLSDWMKLTTENGN